MKEQIKKVVLAALVAAVSIAAQASPIYFTISDVAAAEGSSVTKENQYYAYIFAASDTQCNYPTVTKSTILAALSSGTLDEFSKANTPYANNQMWCVGNDTPSNGKANWSNKTLISNTTTYKDENRTANTLSIFALILDGTASTATHYMFATKDGSETILNTTVYDKNNYRASFDFGSQSANTWSTIASIPEPTSGLLLVLGVTMLALKRRCV